MNGNYHHLHRGEYDGYQPSGYYPWKTKPKQTKKPIEITNTNKLMIVETKEDLVDETIKNDCLYLNEIKK
jgi:hypothetical protein